MKLTVFDMFIPKTLRADYKSYCPAISEEIMEVHYSKHYLTYVKNLNDAISANCPEFFKCDIPEILMRINEIPEQIRTTVRNNGGGAVNHEILWETISTSETQIHEGKLKQDICKEFQTWEKFISEMANEGAKLFGSGWVWLILDQNNNKLRILTSPNQDSPYMNGYYPIFGIDVWEHAYYLQYKNVRKEYINNFLKIVDWQQVEKRYLSAIN